MFDCNLIKSREQKMRDILLPSLESTYQKTHVHDPGATPRPNPLMPPNIPAPAPVTPVPAIPGAPPIPTVPTVPAVPPRPSTPPESELDFPISPLLPRILPASPNITVPPNPLLPPGYSTTMDYEGLQYLNGYLRTQINRNMQVEFLVGSTNIITKGGKLVGVGLNYILLEDLGTGDVSACDFYTIKFCRFFTDGTAVLSE
ncbi:MAG TPA: hypothetical protein VN381_12275 [Anaerovoracaceae bacterium]|nr:hypothetical protein [Anaerovoracaceae bacterium]